MQFYRSKMLAAGAVVAGAVAATAPLAVRPLWADEPKAPAAKEDPFEKTKRLQAEFDRLGAEGAGKGQVNPFPLDGLNEQMQKQLQEAMKQMQGRGFAGPMMFNGPVRKPRLGVQVTSPSPELVDQLDLPKDQGVVIQDVVADSPAEKAGFKRNDILLEIGGKKVPTTQDGLVRLLDGLPADSALDAKVIRKNRAEKISGVKLANVEVAAAPVDPFAGGNPFAQFGGFAGGASTSIQIVNGEFTIKSTQGNGRAYTVVGRKDGDDTTVSSVKVRDGEKSLSYNSLNDVPKEYREAVDGLLKGLK